MEANLELAYFQLLTAISDTFSSLQPTYFPGFAFSWLSLVSHRHFMPKLLLSENREGWSAFHKLLLSLFKFLAPFLKEADPQLAAFLSEYYFSLCDVIPRRCIQLRNIIISAFPLSIVLPDPHLRNIKFDSVPEMGPIPPSCPTLLLALKDLRHGRDQYLLNRGVPVFLASLKGHLKSSVVPEGITPKLTNFLSSILW
ncbi:CCR4-Not complex component [Imleria badia]|nr:CCR4-Not complex component [Imleria badia]